MPFGPKQTTGILGHYSRTWTIALQLGAEACGSWWKPVEDMWETVNKLVIGRWIMMVKEKLIVPYGNRTWTAHFLISRAVKA